MNCFDCIFFQNECHPGEDVSPCLKFQSKEEIFERETKVIKVEYDLQDFKEAKRNEKTHKILPAR